MSQPARIRSSKPLSPNGILVSWDPTSNREIEDAKTIYRAGRSEGREIQDLSGSPVAHFDPATGFFRVGPESKEDETHQATIIDESGDRIVTWDATDSEETKEALELVNSYLAKGWKAYSVSRKGLRRRVLTIDPKMEEVILADPADLQASWRAKFKDFFREFKKTTVAPRTRPG